MDKRMEHVILPEAFEKKMKRLLGDSFESFREAYEMEEAKGLRVNTLKLGAEEFKAISPFLLEEIPWTFEGFYYSPSGENRPGLHPYHEAGLYYIQEPSAMAVGTLFGASPGERILDLCAAPGGKTTQLAAGMQGKGLLVSNEPHPARAKILSRNVERMGIKNTLVTNETPERLSARFPGFFDRILVDAPCSGEGMFRKKPGAAEEWSEEQVGVCSRRQSAILSEAQKMLRPGGRLVYSTCTFSPEENEEVIDRFLRSFPEFELEQAQVFPGFQAGRPDWAKELQPELSCTVRLWPHMLRGEGHFIAVLKKTGRSPGNIRLRGAEWFRDKRALSLYRTFEKEALYKTVVPERLLLFGSYLYEMPEEMPDLDKLRVLRPGLCLGELKKGRFEPAHALALSLEAGEIQRPLPLDSRDPRLSAYLRGETIPAQEKGFRVVLVDGFPIGWGKAGSGILKNHYPKGLRVVS